MLVQGIVKKTIEKQKIELIRTVCLSEEVNPSTG